MTTPKQRPMAEDMPPDQLPYPASQEDMAVTPQTDLSEYKPAGKLAGKRALVTGGDSGIGRAVALAFVLEGAQVAIVYNENDADAAHTKDMVEARGGHCTVLKADVRDRAQCAKAVDDAIGAMGGLDILINNAAFQKAQPNFEDIAEQDFRRTLETNIFGYFHMAQLALPHLSEGSAIVNTGSIVGLVGNEMLVDYCASKGAIHAFTKALALSLAPRKIRVNCVAPGPVWTPNIPGTMPASEVQNFGHEVAMKRPGQPEELAPAYVYLASQDASFVTGIILEVTGGKLSSG